MCTRRKRPNQHVMPPDLHPSGVGRHCLLELCFASREEHGAASLPQDAPPFSKGRTVQPQLATMLAPKRQVCIRRLVDSEVLARRPRCHRGKAAGSHWRARVAAAASLVALRHERWRPLPEADHCSCRSRRMQTLEAAAERLREECPLVRTWDRVLDSPAAARRAPRAPTLSARAVQGRGSSSLHSAVLS